MRAVVIAVAAVAGCSFRPSAGIGDGRGSGIGDGPPDSPPDVIIPTTGFEKSITVQRAMVAIDVTAFPVWIEANGDADLIAHARADHRDVYFLDFNHQAVPFEITGWDQPSGKLRAWVRAQHLTPSPASPNPNVFYVRFGGPDAPTQSDGHAVFNNNFSAVWHLDAVASTITDATGNANGTVSGTAPTATASGKLGNAATFAATDTQITFTNPITGGGPSTMSAWVNETTKGAGVYAYAVINIGTTMQDQARWLHSLYGGDGDSVAAGLYGDDQAPNPASVITPGAWTLLHWTVQGQQAHLYVNGAEIGSGQALNQAATTMGATGVIANAAAAYSGGGTMSFAGVLDEVRLANTARSPQWILTEYRNQNSPSTFYQVGTLTSL